MSTRRGEVSPTASGSAASSTSKSPMRPVNVPERSDSLISAEARPAIRLAPVRLCTGVIPAPSRIEASRVVVVVFPLVPVMSTQPRGSPSTIEDTNAGSIPRATRPGSVDPPPNLRIRLADPSAFPMSRADPVLIPITPVYQNKVK